MDIRYSANQTLDQLAKIISTLGNEQYAQKIEVLHGNSIGKHARHVIEFFESLDIANSWLEVNYDKRKRNLKLEENTDFAINRIAELQEEIQSYEEKMLTLISDFGYGPQKIYTTMYRELAYNIEHCVHHLAIIKIGIENAFPETETDQNVGVAYSTIQFQNANLTCAQ